MAVFRVTYSGTLGASEIFAYGWNFEGTGTAADQVAACTTWLNESFGIAAVRAVFADSVAYNRITVALKAVDGTTISTAEASVALAGTGNVSLPYEVSCCVSLRTGLSGPRNRGRYYLPPPTNLTMATGTGTFLSTFITTIADNTKIAFDNFTTSTRFPEVVSQAGGGSVTAVTGFDIGNVPDAQRRRRNKQQEVRAFRVIVV